MINLLIGPPGGGKSYEAVVYHVLVALGQGRKVITNLPLVMPMFAAIDPSYPALIEIRKRTLAPKPETDWKKAESLYQKFGIAAKTEFFSERAFANPEDYADSWRHPVSGCGPFYVIDECHLALPRGGTKRGVEEWFSLHRHESADVLLITQSYGKVSVSIIELVQVCYRVRKATAFGSAKSYIRKVQDGVRGEVVNTAVRKYEPRYFGLYLSHTRGGGSELGAVDIVPIWKRWPFLGAAVCIPLAFAIMWHTGSIFDAAKPKAAHASTRTAPAEVPSEIRAAHEARQRGVAADVRRTEPVVQVPESGLRMEPYAQKGLHYQGKLTLGGKTVHVFGVSHNGAFVGSVTSDELEAAGYRHAIVGECTGWLYYGKTERPVLCDVGTVGPTGSTVRRGPSEGPPAGGGADGSAPSKGA